MTMSTASGYLGAFALIQVPPLSEPHYHLDFQMTKLRGNDDDDGDWGARGTFSSGSRAGLSTPLSTRGPRSGSSEFPPWVRGSPSGLLTGTSASLLGNLGDDLNNVVNKLKPAVEKGLETVKNTLESVVQKLTADLGKLQESKAWLPAKEKVQEMKNLVNDVLSEISPAKDDTLGLNIINSHILKVKVELTPDGKGVNIRVPIVANVTLALPVIGQVVDLKASLDLLTDVRVATDAQTGAPRVIIGKCSSDPDSISLTVLDSHNTLMEKAVNTVSNFLTKTVSRLGEKDVCPLIHTLLSTLDANIVQDIIDKLQKEDQLPNDA
uniref:BPI fold-containing family A member 2 n=1 Tax=Odobenus rosmarus divergens TaxID=9708 RepID=UPI00063CF72C|nr:PREDICTED: BPI fold-containing family A member 2 [Odobenus rosmarus divergens]